MAAIIGAGEAVEEEVDAVVEIEYGAGDVELVPHLTGDAGVRRLTELLTPRDEVGQVETDEAGGHGQESDSEFPPDAVVLESDLELPDVGVTLHDGAEDEHIKDCDDDKRYRGDQQPVYHLHREVGSGIVGVPRADLLRHVTG